MLFGLYPNTVAADHDPSMDAYLTGCSSGDLVPSAVFVAEPVLFPTRHTPLDKMPNVGATAQVSVPITQLALAFMAELGKSGIRIHTPLVCRPSVDPESDHFAGAITAAAPPRVPRRARSPQAGPLR